MDNTRFMGMAVENCKRDTRGAFVSMTNCRTSFDSLGISGGPSAVGDTLESNKSTSVTL